MTKVDQSINDYLLWLNALRGQATEDTPVHIAREAKLVQQLMQEYRDAYCRPADEANRLETNWAIIWERLRVAEAARALEAARTGAAATSAAGRPLRDRLRTVGSAIAALHRGTRLFAAGILASALMLMWSQWRTVQTSDDSPANVGEPYLRGDENTQRIKQANPPAFADRVVAVLLSAGVSARRVALVDDLGKATGAIHLQAKVPPDSSTIPALQSIGIVTPQSGRLDVVIVPER